MKREPTEGEIDDSFQMLIGNNVVTLPQLEFLIKSYGKLGMGHDRENLLDRICKDLNENLAENYFFRWDIDPWDTKRDDQAHSDLPECNNEAVYWLQQTHSAIKKGVLTAIVSYYRLHCKIIVDELALEFRHANKHKQIMDVLSDAVSQGVFKRGVNGNVIHNHNWVGSKDAFIAYREAIASVP